MIYAQIRNQQVVNTTVVHDGDVVEKIAEGYDSCVRVDDLSPTPGIGWGYVDGIFVAPPQPPPEEPEE